MSDTIERVDVIDSVLRVERAGEIVGLELDGDESEDDLMLVIANGASHLYVVSGDLERFARKVAHAVATGDARG